MSTIEWKNKYLQQSTTQMQYNYRPRTKKKTNKKTEQTITMYASVNIAIQIDRVMVCNATFNNMSVISWRQTTTTKQIQDRKDIIYSEIYFNQILTSRPRNHAFMITNRNN